MSRVSGELAGGDTSGWGGRLPRGMCPYVLGTEGPCLEILITHFLNSLPHPTTSSRRSLSPQDPAGLAPGRGLKGPGQQQPKEPVNDFVLTPGI